MFVRLSQSLSSINIYSVDHVLFSRHHFLTQLFSVAEPSQAAVKGQSTIKKASDERKEKQKAFKLRKFVEYQHQKKNRLAFVFGLCKILL